MLQNIILQNSMAENKTEAQQTCLTNTTEIIVRQENLLNKTETVKNLNENNLNCKQMAAK